jgi:RimJ/RimL family protein N-acetyltransferase
VTTFTIPTLETKRLTLRAPHAGNFDAYAGFLANQRGTGVDDPLTRHTAWLGFAADLGHWHLRGYGFWAVEEITSGKTAGMVGFFHPEGWPEPELGWTLFDGFEGRGYAIEAARRARDYAYDDLGWETLISVIAPDNARSIALAEKLGATLERDWTSPTGDAALIYRHPAPAHDTTGDST